MNNRVDQLNGVAAHTASDIDLLQEIWSRKMPNNVKAQWVKAHQDPKYPDRDLSPEAVLNCKVDTDASVYMSTMLEPSSTPPILPTTAATLAVAGVVVTNKMREVFRSAASCTDLPFYIRKKTGWTIKMMAM
eukprot:13258904-Ditylum_brightwellii.AAC.1